jgi:hypothetical protein
MIYIPEQENIFAKIIQINIKELRQRYSRQAFGLRISLYQVTYGGDDLFLV